MGKEGLNDYASKGHVSSGGEAVSRTHDFGFADYSTAQAFKVLLNNPDFKSDATELGIKVPIACDAASVPTVELLVTMLLFWLQIAELERRAIRAVESFFDSNYGLMVPKNIEGRRHNFNPQEWGNGMLKIMVTS
jgi:hypothetical protein